ncbi:MAG: four helix bundle protein [Gemmatimonadota bacterium]|nr:four helix bundle protein [Gemmatimonadota bacterium]
MTFSSYRDLLVWQKSIDLVEVVYASTARFPSSERYGLSSQARRAAVSIAANIAEGRGRGTQREFLRYLLIANGSVKELETETIIAQRLGLLAADEAKVILVAAEEIGRMLAGLRRKLLARVSPG